MSQPTTAATRRMLAPASATSRRYYQSLKASSVGIELAVAVTFSLFFGMWLDGKLGTRPLMMLVWLGIGCAAGMRAVFRHVRESDRLAAESKDAEPPTAETR